MSYQVGDACYSTPLAAVQAMAAKEVGGVRQIGTATYVVDSTGQTATSITYVLRNVSNTSVVTTTETVTPLPCGLLDTADGLIIAWGIAACWLAVAGILFIRRGLHE
jgi:hypothetical protein